MIGRGDALIDIGDERSRQVSFGHDDNADAALHIAALPIKAREFLIIAIDRMTCARDRRDLPRARRKLVQAGALVAAAIDRLDRELDHHE